MGTYSTVQIWVMLATSWVVVHHYAHYQITESVGINDLAACPVYITSRPAFLQVNVVYWLFMYAQAHGSYIGCVLCYFI